MTLVLEAIFIAIDITCRWDLREISCLRHLTPMGFSRRGRCPHLPLKICQWHPDGVFGGWATPMALVLTKVLVGGDTNHGGVHFLMSNV